MKDDSHLYLDAQALRERGWTETLIKKFLGAPDSWEPVNHWTNFTGKRTFFLERIELAEQSARFQLAFAESIRRRKLNEAEQQAFFGARAATADFVSEWRSSLNGDDIRKMQAFKEIAEIFRAARRRGYRTPQKA